MILAGRSGLSVLIAVGAAVSMGGTAHAAQCAETQAGFSLNCTANDTRVASIAVTNVIDPCTGVGDTATLQLRLKLVSGANNRYDIGYYVALDGGDAYTGNCYTNILTPVAIPTATPDPSSGSGPYLDADGDACGDIAQNVDTFVDLPPLVFQCADADNNGQLDISAVVVWTQNAMDVCTAAPAVPGNSSKCEGSTFGSINVPVPTRTPTSSPTNTPTNTATATRTGTATATASPTRTPANTATNTPTHPDTPTNTPTNSATPTNTAVNTATHTATSTNTPVNTATDTPTNTATPTNTPVDTATSTATATSTHVDTATSTPTNTATPTNTPVNTATSTATSTDTPVNTATDTPPNTATPTNTPVDTATSTATATSTHVNTATSTPTNSATPTNTPVNTTTNTATPTNTPTHTATPTNTPLNTPTATATATFEEITPIPEVGPNIALFKSFPGLCRPSTTTTFTLLVRNIGDAPASPVTVSDPMPAGMSLVSAAGGATWDCTGSSPAQLLCIRNSVLNAGASAPVITATVTIAGNAGAVLVNTAIATTPGDLDAAEGTSTAVCRRNPVPAPAASPWALATSLLVLIGLGALALRRLRV